MAQPLFIKVKRSTTILAPANKLLAPMINKGLQLILLLSVVILGFSLVPVRNLRNVIPTGKIKVIWGALSGLIFLCIAGILVFAWINATEGLLAVKIGSSR